MNNIEINIDEVLRYMSVQKIDDSALSTNLFEKIEKNIKQCMQLFEPKHLFQKFDIEIDRSKKQVRFCGTNLLVESLDIFSLLEKCNSCYIFCATLGQNIEKFLETQKVESASNAFCCDTICSVAIENYADKLTAEITSIEKKLNNATTFRYGAGYGDLNISIQPKILNVMNANKKIGLFSTDNFLLTPRKSITAFIGVCNEKEFENNQICKNKCHFCNNLLCKFRKI